MAQIVWTEAARDDLREIYDYIARDSWRWSQATVERIMDATWRLADFAKTGGRLAEFPDSPYREIYWRSYRIIYREHEQHNAVFVVAVIHGARDLPAIFPDRMKDDPIQPTN
jgi:plasmid stabilization system protein ParE